MIAALVAVALLCVAAPALAEIKTFYFDTPCYDAGPAHPDTACGWSTPSTVRLGSVPESTPLKEARLTLVRLGWNDSLHILIPMAGLQCDSLAVSVDHSLPGHYEAQIEFSDMAGNWSCGGPHHVYAIPARDIVPGLFTEIYDNPDFTAFVRTRTDPKIDFDWDFDAPEPGMGVDQFSIRWSGFLTPATSGVYQLHALVEDGCRVKVGSTIVIDDLAVQEEHERTGSVTLQGGTRYDLLVEHMAWNGDATMRLSWTPPGGTKAVIPAEALSQ